MRKKMWKCSFKGCEEIAQWYRKSKGQVIKACTKHEALLAREHWGRRVDYSELTEEDIRQLETQEYWTEFAKEHPFEVLLSLLEDGYKVRIRDRETGEWRSLVVKKSDMERFNERYSDLERKRFATKPSIDDYVEKLRNGATST
jgi:hypothetical protein